MSLTHQKADRHNNNKPKMSMILEAKYALRELSDALEYGEKKYGRGNWRKGLNHTEICDSLSRHLSEYLSGQDIDDESNCRHVGHILANALFLAEMINTHPELDDRS